MKKLRRGLFYFLGCSIALLVLLRITVPMFAPAIASRILSRWLNAEVSIKGMRLHVLTREARIRHISIAQPEAFTNAPPLLTIRNPRIKVQPFAIFQRHLHIVRITVDDLQLHLIRNAEGDLNLWQLIPERTADITPKEEQEPRDRSRISVTLSRFYMPQALITVTDLSASPAVQLTLTNLQVEVRALYFDPAPGLAGPPSRMPGRIRVTSTIQQPGFPDGYLGLKAATGTLGWEIPPINAAARIVGFDIRTLSGVLPPGIATAIGGNNLDVVVDASLAPDHLRVQTRVHTAGNTLRLGISGTPRKPIIDKSTALFNLITRPGAFLTGTVEGVTDAGIAAGKTVISTASKAGGGIFSGIWNFGRGAAHTVQSAAKGDIRGMGDGVVDMTYGTVTGAVGTVTATAMGVGEGISQTASAATGRTQTRDWQQNNRQRWESHWEKALDFATNTPFPGTLPERLDPTAEKTEVDTALEDKPEPQEEVSPDDI